MKTLFSLSTKKRIAYLLIALTLFYTISCNYFKVKKIPANELLTIDGIGKMHKSFFIFQGVSVYSLSNIHVDSAYISGYLSPATNYHFVDGRSYRYKNHEDGILNEVHINLIDEAQILSLGTAVIPLSDISNIDIIEKDSGKTAASYVFGTLAVITGAFIIISVIYALTKSSCPYVYVHDSEGFVFEGETFGGAIASNLQRDDYMPLPSLKPSNETCRIRISNELKERQYTDLAQLIVVEHKSAQNVLLDKNGKPHLILNINLPLEANTFSGENLLPTLSERDRNVFFFNDEDYSKNGVTMKFNKPETTKIGKLVLRGKNTLWFDYQFGEFLKLFGGFYDEYMDQQSNIPTPERQQRSIDNDFPLFIYIKKQGVWSLVDYLHTIGPLASRDFVVPIEMTDIEGDQLEVKVETGFMFWELDFAGIDFSLDEEFTINELKPLKAIGTGSKDWTNALSVTDYQYMSQENVGEVTEIVYRAISPQENHELTYFLHTSGYYELIRDFEGLPNLVELNKFKTNGYFSDFSREKYLKVLDQENRIASVKNYD